MSAQEPTKAPGVRARVRAELTAAIKESARRQLITNGAAGLSLRAIARELDMASSAIYRYFSSRDDLLTALIIDSYDTVGAVVEEADAGCGRDDLPGRWQAITQSFRAWAIAHPHEYALIYGSPVPGYAAPEDTIGPATRVPTALLILLGDAVELTDESVYPKAPKKVASSLSSLTELTGGTIPPGALAVGIAAWGRLLGMVTLELFGHLHNVVDDYELFFNHVMTTAAAEFLGDPDQAT